MNKLRNVLPLILLGLLLPAGSVAAATNPLLVRPGDMPTFAKAKVEHLHIAKSAPAYVHKILEEKSAGAAKEIAKLKAEGFREGAAAVFVKGHGTAQGLTRTVLLGSHEFALARQMKEYDKEFATASGHAEATRFAAPGIPASTGFVVTVPGRPEAAANLYFTSGSCEFTVGDYLRKASSSRAKKPVLAGAEAVYRRTKGICGG